MTDIPVQTARQLSSHIRSLRKRLGLTQAQLGTRLSVAQGRIGKIERNPGSISVQQLIQLMTVLEADLFIRPKNAKPKVLANRKTEW